MITFFQIAIILLLMALFGMLFGYLLGKLSCKRVSKDTMIQKGAYCEGEYAQEHNLNAQTDNSELEQLQDSFDWDSKTNSSDANTNSTASAFMGSADTSNDAKGEELGDIANSDNQESTVKLTQEESLASDDSKTEASSDAQKESQEEVSGSEELREESSGEKDELASDVSEDTQTSSQSTQNDLSEADDESSKELDTTTDAKNEDSDVAEGKEAGEDNSDVNSANLEESADSGYTPQFLSEPKNGKADNLCEIKGIGTVIDGKLKNLGIFHFEQIAMWTEKDVSWIDEHLAFKGRVVREDWIGQAKLLAKGEETEFSKRVQNGEVESSKKD